MIEQRQSDRTGGATSADQKRAGALHATSSARSCIRKTLAIEHIAMPAPIHIATRDIGGAEKPCPFRQCRAMRREREFVGYRCDQPIDIASARQQGEARADIGWCELQRDHDPVPAALVKLARQPARRFYLRDRIADDDAEPRRAAIAVEHH
jgi:hypothetical protein